MSIAVLILSFLPGYLILDSIVSRFNDEEKVVMSFGFTALLIGIEYSLAYLLSPSIKEVLPQIYLYVLFFLLVYRVTNGKTKTLSTSLSQHSLLIVLVFVVQYLLKVSFQPMIPFYPMGADFYEHYQRSQVFLDLRNVDPYVDIFPFWYISDRTPLFNIIGTFFLALFKDRYWILQVTSCLFNSVLVLPVYLIAKRLFDEKVAVITTFILSMNPFLTENALYTWPKNLAAYFCLLFLYILLFHRSMFFAGLFAALGYLSHQYVSLYILAGVVFLLWERKGGSRASIKSIGILLLTFCVFTSPWFLWKGFTYGPAQGTKFLSYPFATGGVLQVVYNPMDKIIDQFLKTPISRIIWIRVANALETVIPLSLFSFPINSSALSKYYFHTIPGGLTLVILFFVLKGISRNWEVLKRIVWFVSIPFFGSLLLYGWLFGAGLARQTLQPVVALLPIFAAKELSERGRVIFLTTYLAETVEYCILIWWIHIYDLYLLQRVYTPGFCRKMFLAWDLVDPNQLFFILPTIVFQFTLVCLGISEKKSGSFLPFFDFLARKRKTADRQ